MPVIEKSSDGRQSLSVRRGDAYTNFSVPKRPGRAPNTGTHTKKRGRLRWESRKKRAGGNEPEKEESRPTRRRSTQRRPRRESKNAAPAAQHNGRPVVEEEATASDVSDRPLQTLPAISPTHSPSFSASPARQQRLGCSGAWSPLSLWSPSRHRRLAP